MEATGSGALLRRVPIGFRRICCGDGSSPAVARVKIGDWFKDEGHLRYYASSARCGGKKKEKDEKKMRMKAVKGLEKDLNALCSVGVGGGGEGMVGEIKGQIISEAAELLLSQLKQLRAEEKEMKKRRKQEKATIEGAKMKNRKDDSSSSSSESSDSECETVVKMSSLKTLDNPRETKPDNISNLMATAIQTEDVIEVAKNNFIADIAEMAVKPMDKIEVCMGGKCKKLGAMELLAEFERKVGIEGAVVGCKCMGKCRNGPNVRVVNHQGSSDDGSLGVSKNPLRIGVALEDVGSIVANFWGENKDAGLLAA